MQSRSAQTLSGGQSLRKDLLRSFTPILTHVQKKLQLDIEQAGAQIIDRVAELDQASSKLEVQRNKVELSKGKVEVLARNLAQQQELLKSRESTLVSQV